MFFITLDQFQYVLLIQLFRRFISNFNYQTDSYATLKSMYTTLV